MKSESPWTRLSEFISRLKKSIETNPKPDPHTVVVEKWLSGAVVFSKEDLGGVIITGEDANEYRASVNAVYKDAAGNRGQLSRAAAESAIQIAILKALDILQKDLESDLTKRVPREIAELRKVLRKKPVQYTVHLEVQGLDSKNLPRPVGLVKFHVPDANSFREAEAAVDDAADEAAKKRRRDNQVLQDNLSRSITGKTYGSLEVEALDDEAAALLAEKELRLTLDVLNYFDEFFSHKGARVFLPGEAASSKHVAVLEKKGENAKKFSFSHRRPLFPFSFPSRDSDPKGVQAFERASSILHKRERGSLDTRILSALQWAGRASSEDRKDEALLLYCISLEALLLKNDDREIAFSFALRGAHLLVKESKTRKEAFDDLKRLYGLRSKIVHAGKSDISDTDLVKARSLAKSAIFIVLTTEPFANMTQNKEFDKWFEEQQLAGTTPVEESQTT